MSTRKQPFTRLNADFGRRAVIRPVDFAWVPSPMPGVERMMLDRIGGEVARATSLVRYAPNSTFSPHTHGGGEEYLVLEGVFSDEHGDYPEGTYVRNPVGTSHTPHIGPEGCVIFVKLYQFEEDDKDQKSIDRHRGSWQTTLEQGREILPLHRFAGENVVLERWRPGVHFPEREYLGGAEILVLEGTFTDAHGDYPKGSWLRLPPGSKHAPMTGQPGAVLYMKTGHLPPRLHPALGA
jgi:anti-sigma factor ChrR (cupin superfamily)